jgi:hypothetical protein
VGISFDSDDYGETRQEVNAGDLMKNGDRMNIVGSGASKDTSISNTVPKK